MATVSSIALEYSAKGAKQVQRADRKVRDSVQKTAKTAQKETGTVNRWMERNKTAISAIGAASAGAMAAIISASPTMRAELSGVRMAFSLFADTIVNDVLPEGHGLADLAFDLEEAYHDLDPAIREPLSALILFGSFAITAAVGAGLLYGSIVGTGLAAGLITFGGAAKTAAIGVLTLKATILGVPVLLLGLAAAAGIVGSELVGITDATPIVERDLNSMHGLFADLGFFIGGPFLALVLTGIAGFTGGWENAKRVFWRVSEEMLKSTARFATRVHTGFLALGQGLRTVMELAWDLTKNEFKKGWNSVLESTVNGVNSVIEQMNRLPNVDIEPVDFEPVDVEETDKIVQDASDRMDRRLQDLSQRANRTMQQHEPESIRVLPEGYGSEAAEQIAGEQAALQDELTATAAADVAERERELEREFDRDGFDTERTGRREPPMGGGEQRTVQTGDINVTVQGVGNGREDGKRIADEVSKEINDQFEARR